jgi:hypothetical protein
MFESRSSDDIFLGYASHSRVYRTNFLETNSIMETCEVTFDETMPCTTSVFKCASEQEIGESIFVEEQEDADWGDLEPTPLVAPIDLASTTSAHSPDPSTSTTWWTMRAASSACAS